MVDKIAAPGIFDSTTLIELSLSRGGSGWGKVVRNVIGVGA